METAFVAINTPEEISRFRALCLAQGLEMYAKFKMVPTRKASPTFMLAEAAKITGRTFKRGAYVEAAQALRALL
jgi:hypothetical protein